MNDRTPERPRCEVCGRPLQRNNQFGICSNKTPECRQARDRKMREPHPQPHRITIKPGDTFGLWTALEEYALDNRDILCRCACGVERHVTGGVLVNGRTRSCGNCTKRRPRPRKEPYMTAGSIFGRLTVPEDVAYAHDYVRCRCECGVEVRIKAASVRTGRTRSCGCLHRELMTKHGLSGHPLYQIWKGILARCVNPNGQSYEGYGARGVTICGRWRDDVAAFIADVEREIGPRPEGKGKSGRALYELDRTDNDGSYEPGNIRWSTRSVQMQNRRKVPKLTRDVLRLTSERDFLAARLAEVEAALASRRRKLPAPVPDSDVLF